MVKKQVKATRTRRKQPIRQPQSETDGMVEVVLKPDPVVRRAPKEVSQDDLPYLAEKICGWSPRITVYCFSEAELRKYTTAKHFSPQNPMVPQYTIGQYNLREVGAWKEEINPRSGEPPSDKRIVEVSKKD